MLQQGNREQENDLEDLELYGPVSWDTSSHQGSETYQNLF